MSLFLLLTVCSAPERATGNRSTLWFLLFPGNTIFSLYKVVTNISELFYQIRADGFMALITTLEQDSAVSSVNGGIINMSDIVSIIIKGSAFYRVPKPSSPQPLPAPQ